MNNNQWITEQIIEDLDLLSKEGVVGFYSRCEITEIFLFKKKGQKKQQTLNLLTLVVFEEVSIPAESKYLTPKGVNKNPDKRYSL